MADLARVRGLVLDASMLINLLATQECGAILHALAVSCVAPEQALAEVTKDPVSKQRFSERKSVAARLAPLKAYALSGEAYEQYLTLAGAPPPNGLGDGEAACIAAVGALGYTICLDDAKARRICAETFPTIAMLWSAELIGHARVVKTLGKKRSDECFHQAKHFGRMRTPPHWPR